MNPINPLVQISPGSFWKQLATGDDHTVGIKADGTLWTWGDNGYHQLGDNSSVAQSTLPVQISTATNWKAVAAGSLSPTFALKTDGTIWGWGSNDGQLLAGGGVSYWGVPTLHNPDTDWAQITMGLAHVLAIKTNGTLWGWGSAAYGETGHVLNQPYFASVPYQIPGTWSSVAAGGKFSMGIKPDGTLWAWGLNDVGQLGDGTTTSTNIPVQLGTANNWVSVACGYQHTVALRSDGSFWAWGQNFSGQLGNGTVTSIPLPTNIPVAGCVLANEAFAATPATVTLAPNPAQNELHLRYNGTSIVTTITIIDLTGRTVFSTEALNTNSFTVNCSIANLQSGSYLVLLKNKETVVASERLIKE